MNTYFQFKQFTVHQENCAMKVCTDACLFGAWLSTIIAADKIPLNGLDIGTGTGLLSLMLAQQTPISIDAIEMDQAAYLQATSNVELSNWSTQIQVYLQRLQDFYPDKKYDLIFSNPPFFNNDLQSADAHKNMAKHEITLTTQVLFESVDRLIVEEGRFAVLIPFHRRENYINTAEQFNLYVEEEMQVKQSHTHSFFRSLLLFSKTKIAEPTTMEMSIKDANNQYTEIFTGYLKPYYFYL
ncbi:MAG: tRNA1(Val) (adenine(37)-N6)-methyltransferase [Ferruginibacter sp.]